jgi:hypothetical protein
MLLNRHRQIVYANAAAQQMLCGDGDPATLYGCRLGEVMRCVHAKMGGAGCGTSPFCRICGAQRAVTGSLDERIEVQHCSFQLEGLDVPLEVIISSAPVAMDHQSYVLVMIQDKITEDSDDAIARQVFAIQRIAAEIEIED